MTLEIVTIKQGKQPANMPSANQPEETRATDTTLAKSEQHTTAKKQRPQPQGADSPRSRGCMALSSLKTISSG
jgi:hypothetical protein